MDITRKYEEGQNTGLSLGDGKGKNGDLKTMQDRAEFHRNGHSSGDRINISEHRNRFNIAHKILITTIDK